MTISYSSKLENRRDLKSQRLAISGQVRRPKRSEGACEECRRLKKRCDRRPTCAGCSSRGVTCEYVACARSQRHLDALPRRRRISAQHEGDGIALQMEQLRSEQLEPDTGPSSRSTVSPKSILFWPSVANLMEQISGSQTTISSHSQQSLRIYAEPTMSLPGLNSRRESPELAATTINSYFANYVEQIHSIYPFLDIRNVRELLDDSIMSNVARVSAHRSGAHEAPDGHSKRRNALQVFASSQRVDLDNVLILLVLALGEICEQTKSSSCQQRDVSREFGNPCSLPGAKWYTQAMRSLLVASQDKTLTCAQVYLLAGLFAAHFDRVKESKSWFAIAGQTLRKLVGANDIYGTSIHATPPCELPRTFSESLTLIAAWSCLQLENEAPPHEDTRTSHLAELSTFLSLPQDWSGTESCQATSQVQFTRGPPEELLLFLTAQISLEKHLADLYDRLYRQERHSTFHVLRFELMNCGTVLQEWRDHLPKNLQWNDSDGPPCDMLHARLRAKYWRVRHFMYRPFLSFALNIRPYYDIGYTVKQAAVESCVITNLRAECLSMKPLRQ